MIDKKAFAAIRKDFEEYDMLREDLIKVSRQILKLSKAAIYDIHRNKIASAEAGLKTAKALIADAEKMVAKDSCLGSVGAYHEGLEEFAEASCYLGFAKEGVLPSSKEIGVDVHVYMPALCDLVGEVVRKAINSCIAGDFQTALKIKDFVAELYAELMMFDFPNSPVRRKFDAVKYGLEKLENLVLDLKLKEKLK